MLIASKLTSLPATLRLNLLNDVRFFSVLQRPTPNYEGHIPLNRWEKGSLAVGSAVMALLNPYRGGTPILRATSPIV